MLRSLHVKNMALIEEEEIDFGSGLNILTGETGAGKSILIGSLGVALGSGSFKSFVPENAEFSSVELVFDTDNPRVKEKLDREDLPDMDGQVVISRRFRRGRSISKINGETVPIATVREISSDLIDIHGQHEHQSLLYPRYHLELVDEYAGGKLTSLKEKCAKAYRTWSRASARLREAQMDEKDRLKKVDFISYELNEIDAAGLKAGEDEELESRFRVLSNAAKIQEALTEARELMDGEEDSALIQISKASRALAGIADLDESLRSLASELSELEDLAGDFSRSLSGCLEDFSGSEEEYEEVSQRLDLLNHLKSKYGRTIQEVLAYRDKRQEELERLSNFEQYVEGLKKEQAKGLMELRKACAEMTKIRKEAALPLQEKITNSLVELNFLDVKFEIHFEGARSPSENGADEVSFLISTNPGLPLRPLQTVASGGELSRIMLAIKSVMASKDQIGALIFDEIDTGISGRTAQKVSEKMAEISRGRQVIAITHLAQIASMADNHFLIEKRVEGGRTHTGVRKLSGEEETEELARILGGAQITEAVLANAREMKKLADAYKIEKTES